MDSDSPFASRTAGQPPLASGNGNLFTAMRTLKSEFGDFVGATDWLAPSVRPRPIRSSGRGFGAHAGSDGSHSYRRLAEGDGRYRSSE